MNTTKFNVQLSTNSIENAIKELQKIRKTYIEMMNEDFVLESLEWIKERAEKYHIERNYKFPNSANINKNWHIKKVYKSKNEIYYQLINDNKLVAYIEFGTGLAGQFNPHKEAKNQGYEYDKNAHGYEGWSFYNEEIGIYFKNFIGYEGQSFLYDAFWDYFHNEEEWHKIYDKVYARYMGVNKELNC